MRVFIRSILALPLAFAFALPAAAAMFTLPAGTQVQVRLAHPISSGTASVGQRFMFEAAAPVVIDNRVVIAKGAGGSGHVVSVSKARGKSAGKLTLAFTNIHAADGSLVMLTENSSMKGNAEKGKASTATIAATVALGPLGLFAHNLVKGKDITVIPTQTFPAWVKSNTSVSVR